MQSWGTTSRFDERDTGKEPSKSGVIGLLAAALGIDRYNWTDLEPLTRLSMAVRHDRPGILKRDYQTAACSQTDTIVKASGAQSTDGVVSSRYYLADAAFLVGLESNDQALLEKAHQALKNPVWVLGLGRKSYVPSEPIWIDEGVQKASLRDIISSWPLILRQWEREERPANFLISFESKDKSGSMKMDQPLSSFAERRFGARFVSSEWIAFRKEGPDVLA